MFTAIFFFFSFTVFIFIYIKILNIVQYTFTVLLIQAKPDLVKVNSFNNSRVISFFAFVCHTEEEYDCCTESMVCGMHLH